MQTMADALTLTVERTAPVTGMAGMEAAELVLTHGPLSIAHSPVMSPGGARVLLIEDDPPLAAALVRALTMARYRVRSARTVEEGYREVLSEMPDLLLLDLELPGHSGAALFLQLQDEGYTLPTIVISAYREPMRIAAMLRLGIHDYVTKPFDFHELFARIEATVARERTRHVYHRAGLVMDTLRGTLSFGSKMASLTPRCFELLLYLISRPGQLVTWNEISASVWHNAPDARTNTYRVHICRLRHALSCVGAPVLMTMAS